MSKKKTNTEIYIDIIAAIAVRSASKVEGIEVLSGNSGKTSKFSNDVMAYIVDNKVILDIFINMYHGYNIPHTVCKVQEQIKNDIEAETCYTVETINVKVVSIILKDEQVSPIKNNFDHTDIINNIKNN